MKIKEYINQFKNAIMLPYGIDEEFDKESNEALFRFLDRIYYFLLFFMIFFACGSIYFFTRCEILDVCKT